MIRFVPFFFAFLIILTVRIVTIRPAIQIIIDLIIADLDKIIFIESLADLETFAVSVLAIDITIHVVIDAIRAKLDRILRGCAFVTADFIFAILFDLRVCALFTGIVVTVHVSVAVIVETVRASSHRIFGL